MQMEKVKYFNIEAWSGHIIVTAPTQGVNLPHSNWNILLLFVLIVISNCVLQAYLLFYLNVHKTEPAGALYTQSAAIYWP